uniref:7TM_GPCR_Srx domain-containing protein n=1 Tax=Panagrellus redivivus TaxID=6233 RepID=A0A7E4WD84_PANRE
MSNENIIIAAASLAVCLIAASIQTIQLIVFRYFEDYRTNAAIEIMFFIGVSNLIQAIMQIYTALFMLLPILHVGFIELFIGNIGSAAWVVALGLNVVLALNRFEAFKPAGWPLLVNPAICRILCAISTFIGLVFFGVTYSPLTNMKFTQSEYYWSYDESKAASEIVSAIDFYYGLVCCGAAFVLYVGIILCMAGLRKKRSTSSKALNEFRFLGPFLGHYTFTAVSVFAWHFPGPIGGNYFWIVVICISPTLNLIMNRRIRRRFFAIVTFNRQVLATRVFTVKANSAQETEKTAAS